MPDTTCFALALLGRWTPQCISRGQAISRQGFHCSCPGATHRLARAGSAAQQSIVKPCIKRRLGVRFPLNLILGSWLAYRRLPRQPQCCCSVITYMLLSVGLRLAAGATGLVSSTPRVPIHSHLHSAHMLTPHTAAPTWTHNLWECGALTANSLTSNKVLTAAGHCHRPDQWQQCRGSRLCRSSLHSCWCAQQCLGTGFRASICLGE